MQDKIAPRDGVLLVKAIVHACEEDEPNPIDSNDRWRRVTTNIKIKNLNRVTSDLTEQAKEISPIKDTKHQTATQQSPHKQTNDQAPNIQQHNKNQLTHIPSCFKLTLPSAIKEVLCLEREYLKQLAEYL